MSPHFLTNFEIKQYYQNKPKFNGAYSRNNLPKIKDRAYVINLDEFKSIGTHQIAFNVNGNNKISFDGFGVEHISKEIYRKQKYHNKYLQNAIIRSDNVWVLLHWVY